MNIGISSRSGSGSAAGKIVATVFFGIFAIVGLVFTALVVRSGCETVRPYFWEKTDCVIESSSADEKGGGFEINVRYTYRFNGRPYTGTRFIMGLSSSMNGESAQRAAQRYAAGTRADCFVNSSSPGESTLERGALWPLLFMLVPLVFIAFGVGGIMGVWRARPLAAKPVSERHRSAAGVATGLRLLGLVFMCAGAGVLYALIVRPMLKEAAAAKWPRVPCEIISSRVTPHRGSKGGTSYSIEIRYRYDFGGHQYKGTRYNFDSGTSSSRKWRDEAVANFPPKLATLCFVNPEDPVEAVLSVKPSPDRWFGLLGGIFLVVGLTVFIKAPAMARRGNSRTGIVSDVLPLLRRDAATGEVELRQAGSPAGIFVIVLLVALFWNGIVWVILLNMKSGEWFGRIFVGIFALFGVAFVAAAVYQFLALFNPRPVLTASAGSVPLGGTLDVRWRFTGNVRRLVRLTITLEAREEATHQNGKSTTTNRNVFAILPLLDTVDRAQFSGSAKVTIPRELIHTFSAPNNRIVWTLRVAGDIPKWPDVSAEFPITVLPRDAVTLFQEQPPTI